MKCGAPGQGRHPGTLSCRTPTGARGSGHPTLLLALLWLVGTPVARGEYRDVGCVGWTSKTCPACTLPLGSQGGDATIPKPGDPLLDALMHAALPGGEAWTSPATLLGCSLGMGSVNRVLTWGGLLVPQVTVGPHLSWPTPDRPATSTPAASPLDPG